jgi:ArsR family transcriptional regulator, virulence genes transcriptional regulator
MDRNQIYELHAQLCGVFTSPTRLEMLNLLRHREHSVGELSKLAGIPQSSVSQHLAMMRSQGIVRTRREGVTIFYSIANRKIIKAFDLVTEILLERLSGTEKLSKDLKKAQAHRANVNHKHMDFKNVR